MLLLCWCASTMKAANLLQESTVFVRRPCATSHTVEKKLTTFSITDSSTRMTALDRRAKEVKREIALNKPKTKSGELWSTYIAKAINTFILSLMSRRDELNSIDQNIVLQMMSQSEKYEHRGLAVIPTRNLPSSKKFLSSFNRFNAIFISGLRRMGKFESVISDGINKKAWHQASDLILSMFTKQFSPQLAKSITAKLLIRTGSSPSAFVAYYKTDEAESMSLLLTIAAGQTAYLYWAENIPVKGLLTTPIPTEREVQYWKKSHTAQQLVKRSSGNLVHERTKRNIISTFIGSALGLETLEDGEANLHKIEDLEAAAETSFDEVNKNINRLKNVSYNNSLTLAAEEDLLDDVKAGLDKISYALPEIEILRVIQGKIRRSLKQYQTELESCEIDTNCQLFFNGSAIVLSRPKSTPTRATIQVVQITSMPFLVDKKPFQFDLPKNLYFTDEGNIIPQDNCDMSARHGCSCVFDDVYKLPNICERALLEFVIKRVKISDSSCTGHLKKFHSKVERMSRTSKNSVLVFSGQPIDCDHKCANQKDEEKMRLMGLTRVTLKPSCTFCCESTCADYQGSDVVTVSKLRFIVKEAVEEMKNLKIENVTFNQLLQHLEKAEFSKKSWKEVATELKRRETLSFGDKFKEWTQSHRLANPILISYLVMSTCILLVVIYFCYGPIAKVVKMVMCCRKCFASNNTNRPQNNRQPSGTSVNESVFTAGSSRDHSRINLIRTRQDRGSDAPTNSIDASSELLPMARLSLHPQDTGSSLSSRPPHPPPYIISAPPLAEGS